MRPEAGVLWCRRGNGSRSDPLKSNVNLHVVEGAELLFSDDPMIIFLPCIRPGGFDVITIPLDLCLSMPKYCNYGKAGSVVSG